MNVTLRRLAPGETDLELLAVATVSGSSLCAGTWIATGLPLPPCAFHILTGCPCPTCGATRCVLALVHGHLRQAIGWNPLAFSVIAAASLFAIYSSIVLIARLPRLRLNFGPLNPNILRFAFAFTIAANWAYEIHRGV